MVRLEEGGTITVCLSPQNLSMASLIHPVLTWPDPDPSLLLSPWKPDLPPIPDEEDLPVLPRTCI